jgi:hypothetical protein
MIGYPATNIEETRLLRTFNDLQYGSPCVGRETIPSGYYICQVAWHRYGIVFMPSRLLPISMPLGEINPKKNRLLPILVPFSVRVGLYF